MDYVYDHQVLCADQIPEEANQVDSPGTTRKGDPVRLTTEEDSLKPNVPFEQATAGTSYKTELSAGLM